MYKSNYYSVQAADSLSGIIANLVRYGSGFRNFCFFNSNENSSQYRFIAALSRTDNLLALDEIGKEAHWTFGYLAYELKNKIENLQSKNEGSLNFQTSFFFIPDIIISFDKLELSIHYHENSIKEEEIEALYKALVAEEKTAPQNGSAVQVKQRVSHSEYIANVNSIKGHIQRGDVYELNYCMEFYADNAGVDPATLYLNLNAISEAPFSSYAKFGNSYVIGSSPERFLEKQGNKLITQPIKGTAKRSSNYEEDELIKKELKESIKEKTENVMIVDVARNDLSRIAEKGTVKVDELYGIYTFRQVHQMISTISCTVKKEFGFADIIRATFPMASMTGAPKIRAMELIDQFENSKRGLYSGSLGYVTPEGDFDLNVVIRTIFFDSEKKYLSFSVGSAITSLSDPEKEYEECLLKAKAMMQVLG
ncbi:MAG: anthranilate synthase component I family protein [Bacteroidia bacterium]